MTQAKESYGFFSAVCFIDPANTAVAVLLSGQPFLQHHQP
jgi:hypothetical protein